jgi:hypothetical protein
VSNFDRVGVGEYGQRDFPIAKISRVDILAFGRVEKDWEWRANTGIEVNF